MSQMNPNEFVHNTILSSTTLHSRFVPLRVKEKSKANSNLIIQLFSIFELIYMFITCLKKLIRENKFIPCISCWSKTFC